MSGISQWFEVHNGNRIPNPVRRAVVSVTVLSSVTTRRALNRRTVLELPMVLRHDALAVAMQDLRLRSLPPNSCVA
jgi:hypothetical protein